MCFLSSYLKLCEEKDVCYSYKSQTPEKKKDIALSLSTCHIAALFRSFLPLLNRHPTGSMPAPESDLLFCQNPGISIK